MNIEGFIRYAPRKWIDTKIDVHVDYSGNKNEEWFRNNIKTFFLTANKSRVKLLSIANPPQEQFEILVNPTPMQPFSLEVHCRIASQYKGDLKADLEKFIKHQMECDTIKMKTDNLVPEAFTITTNETLGLEEMGYERESFRSR